MGCALTVNVHRQMERGSALTSWWWQATIPHTMLAGQQRRLPLCNNLMLCPASCYQTVQIAKGLVYWRQHKEEKMLQICNTYKKFVNNKRVWQRLCLSGQLHWRRSHFGIVSHPARLAVLTCKVCQGLRSTTLKVWQLVDAKYWIIYRRTNKFWATTRHQTLGPNGY